MKILIQLALIFGICIAGDIISALLPFAFPGSVISMLLMVFLLLSNLLKEATIYESSNFFLKNMTFFFIPAAVSVMEHTVLLKSIWWQLLLVNLVSLLACFVASSWTVMIVSRLLLHWRKKNMFETIATPLFGITLSLFAYMFGVFVNRKLKNPLANPLIITMVTIITFLVVFDIPFAVYKSGSDIISLFLAPVTAVLSVAIYRQREILKHALVPVISGTLAGSLASLASITWMCNLLDLDPVILGSLLAKSVTTPIAIAITEQFGGIAALTVASTIISGLLGNLLAPVLGKVFFVSDPVAHGVGIGSCSHALGTSKALELGEVQGAMSSIAISLSGICTVLLAPLFF